MTATKKKLDNTWETEEIVKKSKSGSENFILSNIAHEMKVKASEEEAPTTESVHKTDTKKDESLVDKPEEVLVAVVETLATQQSVSDESDVDSQIGSTATGTSCHQFHAAYIEYHNADPNMKNMSMTTMEEKLEALKQDMAELKKGVGELKQGMNALKRGVDVILTVYGIDPTTLQPMGPPAKPAKETISTTAPIS